MTASLESAIALAAQAHAGQLDKGGQPYILHPLRVMAHMKTNEERIVAVLHDVMEDGPLGVERRLYEEYPGTIVDALILLFKFPKDEYHNYIEKIAKNPLARRVKLADLWDNMNLSRLPKVTPEDLARQEKYKMAYGVLLHANSP